MFSANKMINIKRGISRSS